MARKILLADDSVTAQNMGRKILADAGYDVITVNNGSAALKRIAELRPDLIVLDVYMPGYSGLEVCQRLKESADTAHIPVLLTVGKLEPFKPDEARRVRADAHIVKPFEASELLTAISKLEDRMVPQASDSSRFSASAAGVERFGEAGTKRSSAKVPETDTGWKNRIRFPSKKKKEEEPDAEDLAAAEMATLADSRKGKKAAGNGSFAKTPAKEPAIVPDIPRDITPEELDALSAVADRLDAPAVPEQAAPVAEARKFQRRSTDRPSAPVDATPVNAEAPKQMAAATEVAAGPTSVEESPTVAQTQQPVAQKIEVPAESPVEAVATVEVVRAAEEHRQAEDTQNASPTAEATASFAQEAVPAISENGQIATADQAAAETPAASEPFQVVTLPTQNAVESATPSASFEQSNGQSNEQPRIEAQISGQQSSEQEREEQQAADVAAEPVPTPNTENQPAEEAAPSDEELTAALRLLTPATSNSDSLPSNGNHPDAHLDANDQVSAAGQRWVAEAMTLSAEESAISLESEMFGVPSSLAKGAAATAGTGQGTALSGADVDRSFGFSGIAAAVETRLAEAGMGAGDRSWTTERERSAENAASEASAALEASAELLAAASAANPLMEQIGANVEQKIAANYEGEPSHLHAEVAHGSSSREESSATFADAMNRDGQSNFGQNNNEIDSSTSQNGESQAQAVSVTNMHAEKESNSTEVEGQDSMSEDGKKKSGTSNWREIKPAPKAASETHLDTVKENAAAEDSQKAMAAAASDGSNSSNDASTIASIVDSVMADLRPRIVEEIARKLAKK